MDAVQVRLLLGATGIRQEGAGVCEQRLEVDVAERLGDPDKLDPVESLPQSVLLEPGRRPRVERQDGRQLERLEDRAKKGPGREKKGPDRGKKSEGPAPEEPAKK